MLAVIGWKMLGVSANRILSTAMDILYHILYTYTNIISPPSQNNNFCYAFYKKKNTFAVLMQDVETCYN